MRLMVVMRMMVLVMVVRIMVLKAADMCSVHYVPDAVLSPSQVFSADPYKSCQH